MPRQPLLRRRIHFKSFTVQNVREYFNGVRSADRFDFDRHDGRTLLYSHFRATHCRRSWSSRSGLAKTIERENRARTLVSVFQNAMKVAIIGGSVLMILDSVGIPVTALMGGAAARFGRCVRCPAIDHRLFLRLYDFARAAIHNQRRNQNRRC